MNSNGFFTVILFLFLGFYFFRASQAKQWKASLCSLHAKLDALLQAQGIAWPRVSPEVRQLALEGKTIAAIQLHLVEHPGLGLTEAKAEIDALK